VIEDSYQFPKNLGREVIIGMLQLKPEKLKAHFEKPEMLAASVKDFLLAYHNYDWTVTLDE